MPEMTVPEFLKLVAAGDREADEIVAPLVGWRHTAGSFRGDRYRWRRGALMSEGPLPYATAAADHPDRGRYFIEMVEALAAKIPKLTVGHALGLVAAIMSEQGVSANAAAAAALLFTTEPIKEDDE